MTDRDQSAPETAPEESGSALPEAQGSRGAPVAPERPPEEAPAEPPADDHLPVVGIGASAGGLSALQALLSKVPEDSGVAWVVVVHLSPEHESHLAQLLQSRSLIPVRQVTQTVLLEPNTVYVIPPNANLEAIDTHLRLSRLEEERRERAPIDHFLRTLSRTHDGHAVGVILTGTGSDGTLGLKEIKEKGGLAVVQDPEEAEYDGMPRSAIATDLVDLVLPVSEIVDAVLGYTRTQPRLRMPADGEEPALDDRRVLQKVFAHLRARTERDFSHYKRSTILRRVARRMQLRGVVDLPRYLELLRDDRAEAQALSDDLLITVTSFFRDSELWEALAKDVIPGLFEGRGPEGEIRVWSVGCATGEEAYSLAMLLLEEADRQGLAPALQILASDLHDRSLEKAREGFYPGDIDADVSPERLERFFRKEDHGYRVRRELREMVVFAPHNLLGDPPFSRIDLLVCRNLLIYLQGEIQPDVYDLFHYALRPDGVLVMGTAERVDVPELFRQMDKKHQVYRKRNVQPPEPRLPVFPLTRRTGGPSREEGEAQGPWKEAIAPGALHQRMVERFAPPSLLVGPDDRVVHLSEHAGRYLVHPGGEPTSSVFKLVREELRIELRAALHGAREQGQAKRSDPVRVRFNGETARVTLDVRPSHDRAEEGYALVIFSEETQEAEEAQEAAADEAADEAGAVGGGGGDEVATARVREVEAERDLARERLQTVIEEYETSREEMKASNEELQSTNEELRSTMEELETSKEELQSMNEELQTMNQENRHKVEELAQLSSDLQNLLSATEIATVFLDRQLRIMRFTPKLAELFSVRVADRGRPLSDLSHRLRDGDISADARRVLDDLVPVERQVQDEDGRWYQTRILPYRSLEDRIDGVVMTFVDVTDHHRMAEELRVQKAYAESIVETIHEPLLVLGEDLRVTSANRAFYEHFEVRPEETRGRLVYELGNSQWDIPALRELLEAVLPRNHVFNDFRVEHDFDDIGRRVMLLNARRLDHAPLILLGIRDISEA